jgi:flavin-binding protein dodecin
VGIERANKTLKNVRSAWVDGTEVIVDNGKVAEWRVRLKVTFVIAD